MPFSDPIVGGTILLRDAIRSPNYVAGVSGWTINADGSSEFNSATIRGVLEIGFSPNPRISAGGTGTIPAALANFSPDFVWSAAIILWFNGTDFYFWSIGTYVGGGGPFPVEAKGTYDTTNSVLFHEIVQKSSVNFILFGSTVYNSQPANWIYRNGAVTINNDAQLYFDGVNASRRGFQGAFFTTAGIVATSNGAEAAVVSWDANSSASVSLKNGRLYDFTVTFGIANRNAGASSQISIVRLRQAVNSTAATELGRATCETVGFDQVTTRQITFKVLNTSGSDKLITPGVTIIRQTGANAHILYGDANLPMSIEVEEVGNAVDPAPSVMSFYVHSVT